VLDVALDHVVIEAAGVGYKVMATPSTRATLHRGGEARLITAMIVREDSMTLYGFPDGDARDLFLTLLGVSSIGPKIALATLAVYDAQALRHALADGDVTALTRVPGIGKRGADCPSPKSRKNDCSNSSPARPYFAYNMMPMAPSGRRQLATAFIPACGSAR
jgi:Holliday junction DNA helicase RuvA